MQLIAGELLYIAQFERKYRTINRENYCNPNQRIHEIRIVILKGEENNRRAEAFKNDSILTENCLLVPAKHIVVREKAFPKFLIN